MTAREQLARLEQELSRLTTRARNLSSDVYRITDMARVLYTELAEQEAEITRHHRDFARISALVEEAMQWPYAGDDLDTIMAYLKTRLTAIRGIVG